MRELTRFVREVMLPGSGQAPPRLEPGACCFRLRLVSSTVHRWGVVADERIPARRRVIEYTGEHIGTEYINHGCAPNLIARVRTGRVTYVSARPIAAGDELVVDYRLSGDLPPIECHCGAAACRGYLNLVPPPAIE